MRLDYVMANAAFTQGLPRGCVASGEAVQLLSDHYPLLVQWDPHRI